MRQSLPGVPAALSNPFLRKKTKEKGKKREAAAIIAVRGCLTLGSAAQYIPCLLYARTVGSLPKRHRGCSDLFRQSITPGLSHFYTDTNGKYFPGLISTDQRSFLNREEPRSPGGRSSPRGNRSAEERQGRAGLQRDAPGAAGASQDTSPHAEGRLARRFVLFLPN